MTIHMVTSRQNMAHVTADDAAHLNARIMGDGQYLLTKNWAPTLASASRVNLPVGEWLWNGRYVQISVQESINIGNGVSSGSTRDDLICLHYSRNTGSGVETVAATVIRGVVNQGVGVPPITTSLLENPQETYMIIAVVHWAGLTPSVSAFASVEYLEPYHDAHTTLHNLDSRLQQEVEIKPIPGWTLSDSKAILSGGIVHVWGVFHREAKSFNATAWGHYQVGTVSVKPTVAVSQICENNMSSNPLACTIEKDGSINLMASWMNTDIPQNGWIAVHCMSFPAV